MNRVIHIRPLLAIALVAWAPALAGCGWNRMSSTAVILQCGADDALYVVAVPRVLPDGGEPAEQRRELLDALAEQVGGYVYIEKAVGDWRYLQSGDISDEPCDLLLVRGPAQLWFFLNEKLVGDFKQPAPLVIRLPAQSVRLIPVRATSTRDRGARAARPE